MATGNLYQIDTAGNLTRLSPSAPKSEDVMQDLVGRFPELISEGSGELLLIKREQAVEDCVDGSGRWSIDHLFVTRDAVPVLVELKRAVDTRLRREVVGQMLDYAANASAYWQTSMLAESFASSARQAGHEPDTLLAEFLGSADTSAFWEQLGSNLRAGRMKLVFVADVIPRELARIVEFLNDQMEAEVRAVELRWFSAENGHMTLSPRVIGQTERSAVAKPAKRGGTSSTSLDDWIAEKLVPFGERQVDASSVFRRIVEDFGGTVGTPTTRGSLYGCFKTSDGRKFYPLHFWPNKVSTVSLSMKYLVGLPAFSDEKVRQNIYDAAVAELGPLKSKNLGGFPEFDATLLLDVQRAEGFARILRKILDIAYANETVSQGEKERYISSVTAAVTDDKTAF